MEEKEIEKVNRRKEFSLYEDVYNKCQLFLLNRRSR